MKKFRFLLVLAMLFVGIGSYAQTVVEFVAGVDKGSFWFGYAGILGGEDRVEKNGVAMSCGNAAFAEDKYGVYNLADDYGKHLTFTSDRYYIVGIEFVDGENINALSSNGYNASAGKWTGRSTHIDFYIQEGNMVRYSKVIVTLGQQLIKLEFEQPTAFNYIEQQLNTIPAPTIKSGDEVIAGLPLTYESSNTTVADVIVTDGTTAIVPKTEGPTVITARFSGSDKYDSAEGKFTLKVVDGKNIFHESFDKMSGTGGNDGNFDYTSWDDQLNTALSDNAGWEAKGVSFLGSWAYNASKCVRIETGASLVTPALSKLSGDAFFIFRAAQNRDETTTVNLAISGGGTLGQSSITLNGKEFADYMVLVKDATPQTEITLNCETGGSLYLDDVKVERAIVLDAATDNSKVLHDNASMAEGATVNVMLKRSLSSKCWNTLCLPFSIKKEDLTSLFGENTFVVALDNFDAAANEVCFKLSEEIVAGTPCLVWPGTDVTNIMFTDVTPTDKVHNVMSNGVSFKGVYNPTVITSSDVFLDPNNNLDSPDETEGSNRICGFNSYFTGLANVASAKVIIDGNVNPISNVNTTGQSTNDKVYTIDGRYAGNSINQLAKGMYIVGGKKVIVK